MSAHHTFIIAEIGCNHNGDPALAKKMVKEAKACGVDAVKFQTFNSSELISKFAPKADYQKITTGAEGNQLEMTRKLELSHNDFIQLRDYAKSLNLETFSTPFDLESIEFLEKEGQNIWKIPSGEITNLPYLDRIAQIKCKNKQMILSTGMATIEEVKTAVNLLTRFGSREELIILHCNTEYPTPDEDVNLSAIDALHEEFPDIRIGFSDHSVGYVAAIGAVMKDIVLIEKHFTLDKNMAGPDHKASATPLEMKALVDNVRRIEIIKGEGGKKVTESERKNITIARKSIVARKAIKKGEVLSEDNITCKRPGNGISPMHWFDVLGTQAIRNFEEDELISMSEQVMSNEIDPHILISEKKKKLAGLVNTIQARIDEKKYILQDDDPEKICLIGHSQFDKWSIEHLGTRVVKNAGINGISTRQYIDMILKPGLLDLSQKEYVLILGTNDIIYPLADHEICNDINTIINTIQHAQPDAHIILVEILPVRGRLDRDNSKIERVNRMIRQHLPKGVELITNEAFQDQRGDIKVEYVVDGLHLSTQGYELLKSLIERKMK